MYHVRKLKKVSVSAFVNVTVFHGSNKMTENFYIKKGKVHPCTGTEALYRLYGP
jgi:hypothetical protein